jgi:transposase
MDQKAFFLQPKLPSQKQYEALRAFYVEGLSSDEAAKRFSFSATYFKKLRFEFNQSLKIEKNPFFPIKKTGPKKRFTDREVIEKAVILRKQNHSILDIRAILEADGKHISLDTIDNILKEEGFAPLPKRTRQERLGVKIPSKIEAPQSVCLELENEEEFSTEKGAGPLIFLPLIENLRIIEAIQAAHFPKTSVLCDVSMALSFLALKILGIERLSHDTIWNMDRVLGFFARLNVLPKSGTLSSYSYRVNRSSNRKFLQTISSIFKDDELEEGEFNLDFKAIPHWGDASILEKNWSGSRNKSIKSLLALIVQDPSTGYLSYTDAEIKHRNQNEVIFDFVDFWKEGRGVAPKLLIFDSKFTTYKNLSRLNESKEKIKFLTLRRRGKELIKKVASIPADQWQKVRVEGEKRKYQLIRVHDDFCKLRNYKGEVRQIILTDHGREQPTFMITNDFTMNVRDIVKKYARRWMVEKEIAEQIAFFHLNNPSSSMVVKVDFDLTISLLAHNLYRILANNLKGFERCNVPTIYRNFLENGALVKIVNNEVTVSLKKKTHLPILFELPWLNQETKLSWWGVNIKFQSNTTS